MPKVNVKDLLSRNAYKLSKESYIRVNQELCRECENRCCRYVCPDAVYLLDEEDKINVEYEGCLECGTCQVVCPHDAIEWDYPQGGCGILFKYGLGR